MSDDHARAGSRRTPGAEFSSNRRELYPLYPHIYAFWSISFLAALRLAALRWGMIIGKGNNDGIQDRSVSGRRSKMRAAGEENAQSG
jgi:hypothetical protein